jgi:hypothetical protein
MSFRAVSALIGLALLAGCATPYQAQGLRGGFDETQLAPNIYRVTFKGNGFTSPERAADLALLRCADLALQNGYSYFAIVDSKAGADQSTFTTPKQSTTTSTVNVTGNTYGGMTMASGYGQSQKTTYGGDTYTVTKPSSTNTIVLLKSQGEFPGLSYDATFLQGSLGTKYKVERTQ